jgi:hypothetical protein
MSRSLSSAFGNIENLNLARTRSQQHRIQQKGTQEQGTREEQHVGKGTLQQDFRPRQTQKKGTYLQNSQQNSEHKSQQTKKQKQKKKKKKTNMINSPWWDGDRQQLAKVLPDSSGKEWQHGKLAWVPVQHFHDRNSQSCTVLRTVSDPPPKVQNHKMKRSKEQLGPNEVIRTRKLALRLSAQQKETFHQWFGICCYIYNRAVDLVAKEKHRVSANQLTKTILPTLCSDKNGKIRRYAWWRARKRTPWLLDNHLCPRAVKTGAINDYCQAVFKTKESLKAQNKNPRHFQMHHCSGNSKVQTITIPKHSGNRPSCQLQEKGVLLFHGHGLLLPQSEKDYIKLKSLIGDKVNAFKTVWYFPLK